MANVFNANALGATIQAYQSNGDADWVAPETWPVLLGAGVTLNATPGMHFSGPAGGGAILFLVTPSGDPVADALPVTIGSRTPGGNFAIGYTTLEDGTGTDVAVEVNGVDANLSGVDLNGQMSALYAAGLTQVITLGPQPVTIHGFAQSQYGLDLQGGTLLDIGNGSAILSIEGPATDFEASVGTATFSSPIVVGTPPDALGNCPDPRPDFLGIDLRGGSATVTLLGGGTFQCQHGDAISFNGGTGIVFVGNDGGAATGAQTLIHHVGCSGAYAQSGTELFSNTTFVHNHYGAVQRDQGTVALGTGALVPGGNGTCAFCTGNVLGCSSETEPGDCDMPTYPGIDIWNNSSATIHAEGVTLLAPGFADYVCAGGGHNNQAMNECLCSGSACALQQPSNSPPDGAPTVTSSNSSQPSTGSLIDISGATLGDACPQ